MSRFFFVHPDLHLTPRGVIRSVLRSRDLPPLLGALAVIAVVIGGLLFTWRPAPPPPHTSNTKVTYELGAESSGIYMQKHLRRDDGTVRQTLIDYSNGALGTINYRLNGTAQDFVIVAPDGTHTLESLYAADGKTVVRGFELRADRTLAWNTDTLADGSLRTVSFWSDGRQPFSISVINDKASAADFVYFRADGKLWAHQWFKGLDSKGILLGEDLYSARTGLIERSIRHVTDGRQSDTVTYYRIDGTARLRLVWLGRGSHEGFYMELDSTTLFATDGQTQTLLISWSELAPWAITTYNADGTSVVNRYIDGAPRNRKVMAADGTTIISDTANGADPALPAQILPEYRAASAPKQADPPAERQAAEGGPSPTSPK